MRLLAAAAALLFPTALVAQGNLEPPAAQKFAEKPWEQIENKELSPLGKLARELNPEDWKNAETDNFIIHYRRITEARKVVKEIEFNIWFVAKTLGFTAADYSRKSHVFVFQDDREWEKFLQAQSSAPPWASSFAYGDELFLNIRKSSQTGRFDSGTLAHEATHAVIARLYPDKRWPLWLNEGFSEYMAGASVAARKRQTTKRHQEMLSAAEMSLDDLANLQVYPTELHLINQLYQTGEKFVRFLMNELPQERFPKFVDLMIAGKPLREGLIEIYGDKIKDYETFERRFERFTK